MMYEVKMSSLDPSKPEIGMPIFNTGQVHLTITQNGLKWLVVTCHEQDIKHALENCKKVCTAMNSYAEWMNAEGEVV